MWRCDMKYMIDIEKEDASIAVHYDLSVPVGGAELIATFQVWIDGEQVITEKASGNTRFFGTAYTKLRDDTKDTPVAFELTSTQGFEATDTDKLRGGKRYDSVEFSA